jgi:hypothetical protein
MPSNTKLGPAVNLPNVSANLEIIPKDIHIFSKKLKPLRHGKVPGLVEIFHCFSLPLYAFTAQGIYH